MTKPRTPPPGGRAQHASLNRMRRLVVRHERRADIHPAFTTLGCALVCLNQITRSCQALERSE